MRKQPKTAAHDDGGRGDRPGRVRDALRHRVVVVSRAQVLLAHPAEEEHLVVHGQSEEHGEHDDRQVDPGNHRGAIRVVRETHRRR